MKRAYSLRFSRSVETYERWAIPQRQVALELVEFVKPTGKVLDLGCGTGFVSELLGHECFLLGIDISERMAQTYRDKFGRVVVGDVESLPLKNDSFDFVLGSFSLHWTDIRESIPEAVRVSKRCVGLALPVLGSLEALGFPFPHEEEVISLFNGIQVDSYTKEFEIPFTGWDLVRFFHHTGSSLNPTRKRILTKAEINNLINSIEKAVFRVLFLYARVK